MTTVDGRVLEPANGRDGPPWPPEFERILRQHCRFVDAATPVDPDASLAVLGIDSLATLSVIVEIEDAFSVVVPDTMLTSDDFGSPGSMWRAVVTLVGERDG